MINNNSEALTNAKWEQHILLPTYMRLASFFPET